MYKFQYKISILNFLTCVNLHMIEKPKKNKKGGVWALNFL